MKIEIPEYALLLIVAPEGDECDGFFESNDCLSLSLAARSLGEILASQEETLIGELKKNQISVVLVEEARQSDVEKLKSLATKNYLRIFPLIVGDHKLARKLKDQGFKNTHHLETLKGLSIERSPMPALQPEERGPFDIIGDVHGCTDELRELLEMLGYHTKGALHKGTLEGETIWAHPAKRRVIFVGDLIDRGPDSVACLRLAYAMCESGNALCVPGNHEQKLLRKLDGKPVSMRHGLQETWEQFQSLSGGAYGEIGRELRRWLESQHAHLILDAGQLLIAHAGLPERMHGRNAGKVRSFALFGDTTGEKDEWGFPVRRNWAEHYQGKPLVVYGHTPVHRAAIYNNTICLDTGCVFGAELTALRWPERELVAVKAKRAYATISRPLDSGPLPEALDAAI